MILFKKLDIGCGKSKKSGYIGIDILDFPCVDVIHDLNKYPYPFKDNQIDEVWMDQVLEHLENPIKVVEEIYRICKKGAKVIIGVPYFRSFYSVIDPTHKNFFSVDWFQYFNPYHILNKKYGYTKAKFIIEKIEFDKEFKINIGIIHGLIKRIANKNPNFYERSLSHLYPLNSLTFYLKVIK